MPLLGVIIEHLEPVLSKWLFLEYKHAAELARPYTLTITNVKDPDERAALSSFSDPREESVTELGISSKSLLILDPQAPHTLSPQDFKEPTYLVVGGIMGDYPPRGRTYELLTKKIPGARTRNIGSEQFPIDCAVHVALMVSRGLTLNEIPVISGLEIKTSEFHSILLPYAYPLYLGRPLISEEVIDYLLYEVEEDEAEAVKTGEMPSITEKL